MQRSVSTPTGLRRGGEGGIAAASATASVETPPSVPESEITTDSTEAAGANAAAPLHPLRRREVVRLFEEFKTQHADGVCKCSSFGQLLRLHYPTESKEKLTLMLQAAREHERRLQEAEAEAEAASRDAESLFHALDTDGHGTIDLAEFLQLQRVSGLAMTKAELKALFHAKDADGSGELDLDEFRELCADARLLEHKAAILATGAQSKARYEAEKREKQELWKLGLPKAKAPLAPLTKRPSLVGINDAIANMRRAMGAVQ